MHQIQQTKAKAGLPMASTYNETVAVDLHELELGLQHLRGHFAHSSAGSITSTKNPREIVKHSI